MAVLIGAGIATAASLAATGYSLSQGSPDYAGAARKQEEQRQQKITQGTQAINQAYTGFTPKFYQQRQQDYVDFAMPQLAQQYRQAKNQIGFGLANRGMFGGSAQTKQFSDLDIANKQAAQGIVDTGRSQAQALQSQVDASKGNLLNQLYQSADPAGASAQATSTAAGYAQPATFAPIANQFTDLLNQYYYSQLISSVRPSSYVGLPPQYSGGSGYLGPTTSTT